MNAIRRIQRGLGLALLLSVSTALLPASARAEDRYSPFGGEASTAKKATFWTLAASGLVLSTVGLVAVVQRGSLENERDKMIRANGGDPSTIAGPAECRNVSECVALKDKNGDVNSADNRAYAAGLAGIGLMLGAVATLFVWPSAQPSEKAVSVTPIVTTQGARMSVEVRF